MYFRRDTDIPDPTNRHGRFPLDLQMALFTALTVAAVVLVVVLSVALLSIRRNVNQLTQRIDDSLRQFEMTAEDLRKTNAAVRDILSDVERGISNVSHFTEGFRALRGTVDVATKVLDHAVSPALVNVASVLAGFKAATSHILERFVRKEERK
jgi:predicted PurR-regulated permease PerM